MSDFEYRLKIPGTTPIPQLNMSITLEELTDLGVLNGGNECIYIDADRVKSELYVRNRRDGDRFKPLGMRGTKKLKDFLSTERFPAIKGIVYLWL